MRHTAILLFCFVTLFTLFPGCPVQSPRAPDLAGLTREAAESAIVDAGFAVGDVGSAFNPTATDGRVGSQVPSAGTQMTKGDPVDFVISLGPGPEPKAIVSRTVTVTVPQKIDPSSLGFATSLCAGSVDGSGQCSVDTISSGPQLAFVTSPGGNVMLMGWLDDTHQALSPHTTAEVLLYWAAGSSSLTADAKARAIELLREEDLTELTAAIADSIAADPESMAADNPTVYAALQAAMDSYTEQGKATQVSPSTALSGIQVEQTQCVNTIRLTNMYRRSAHAFLDRVSYTPTGGTSVADPAPLMDFAVDPVQGLGSLVETLGDIILGNLAYEYESTKEIRLPVVAGASKTTYTLSLVGMGVGSGDWNRLTSDQQWKQREVALWFVAKDIVWPIAMDIALPAYSAASGGVHRDFLTYDTPRPVLLAEWVNTIADLTGFPEAVADGQLVEATGIAMMALAQNGAVQDLTTDILFLVVWRGAEGVDAHVAGAGATNAFALAQQIMVAARVVDVLLASFDVGIIAKDIARSNVADVWDIEVLKPNIVITPESATVRCTAATGGSQTYVVTVPEATGSVGLPPTFAYTWHVTQTVGEIEGHAGQATFDTSSDSIKYTANPDSEGTDTFTVDVIEVIIDGGATRREYVGSATATATVEKVTVVPFAGSMYSTSHITQLPPGSYHTWIFGWQVGVEFNRITTEPVPQKYAVYGYNFNDPLSFGESVYFIGPPWPHYAGSTDEGGVVRIGLVGGGGGSGHEPDPDSLLDDIEWGFSRFEGAIWEITPIY